MNFVQSVVIRQLRRAGFSVIAPKAAPEVGSEWLPSDGSPRRRVEGVKPGVVVYSVGWRAHAVTLATWHRWVRDKKAVTVA